MPDTPAASPCVTLPGPAGPGAADPPWRPLHDQPTLPPGTLPFALLAHEHAARAQGLSAALGHPDPAGYAARLLRPDSRQQGAHLHGPHLDALTAPHPPAVARALREILGAPGTPAGPGSAPAAPRTLRTLARTPRLLWQATRPAALRADPPTDCPPADRLRDALNALARAAAHPAPLGAALATALLGQVTRAWLNDPGTLHLELLRGDGPATRAPVPGDPVTATPDHALNQLRTTLSGPRRAAALLILRVARRQHQALAEYHAALPAARRAALRAAVRAAATLRERGALSRTADARWLTPHELIAALDGTLPRADLHALIHARRAAAPTVHGAPARPAPSLSTAATTGTLNAAPLAPGVRDGRLRHWTPGTPVPPGAVLLLGSPPWPHHLPALGAAAALLAPLSTLHSPLGAQARRAGQVAVCLPEPHPDWLEDGALVRVNGHTGQLTLLRRAGVPDPIPAFDLNLDSPSPTTATGAQERPTVLSPHVRVLPRPTPFSIDLA